MPGFIKSIASLLSYKPSNVERFELLEDNEEGKENAVNTSDRNKNSYHDKSDMSIGLDPAEGANDTTDAAPDPAGSANDTTDAAADSAGATTNPAGTAADPAEGAANPARAANESTDAASDPAEAPNDMTEAAAKKTSGSFSGKKARYKKASLTVDEWNKNKRVKAKDNQKQVNPSGKYVLKDIDLNISRIKQEFNIPQNQDVIIREIRIAGKIRAFIVMFEGMIDRELVNEFILRQLMTPQYFDDYFKGGENENLVDYLNYRVLSINKVNKEREFGMIVPQLLSGSTALFIDGCDESLLIESRGYEKRNVEQPTSENVVKGAQEGFNENLRTNITLIRRIIRNKNLVTEIMPVGNTNNSSCAVIHIKGITNPKIVNEVKRRIKNINTDFISGAGMVEEAIADQPYMLIPQILTSERPDRAAAMLMDGKVVFITQGTPFASAVPTSFWETLHSPEDFFLKWQSASIVRIIRMAALLMSLFLPALYVALTTYHHEMIPTDLLTSIAKSRENVPFTTILELIVMDISFELLREASLRMPGALGSTLSIIGALILGQAAVSAQIVSPTLIIVVAVAGIGNFAIPNYALAFAVRILRFSFTIMAALAGFYGVAAIMAATFGFACNMKSFGVPFFTPVAPKTNANPDIIISLPNFLHKYRPDFTNALDKERQKRSSSQKSSAKKEGKRP